MTEPIPRPLALFGSVEVMPQIAYMGAPPKWAHDLTAAHPFFTWWEVRSGAAKVTTSRGTWTVEKGEWILIPHGIERRQRLAPDTRFTSLSFRAVWPSGRPVVGIDDPMVGKASGKLVRLGRTVCRLSAGRVGDGFGPLRERMLTLPDWLRMQSLLLEFVAEIFVIANAGGAVVSEPFSGDARLDAIMAALRSQLRAGPLPYGDWTDRFGLGRAQIDRLARRHLGGTLHARRDALLIEEIRRELLFGGLSAKELAAKFEFVDAAHFSRWVRRMTGCSPKELRHPAV